MKKLTNGSNGSKPVKHAKKHALTPEMEAHKWKAGQSGNPHGRRPLAITLAQHVRDIGSELIGPSWTRIDEVIRNMYKTASGSRGQVTQAAQLILDRGWGKVPLAVELNVVQELKDKAEELGINIFADPLTTALFAAAGGEDLSHSEDGMVSVSAADSSDTV